MGDGRVERNRPSCARRAMSQQWLYRYDYLYHLYRSSFRAARRLPPSALSETSLVQGVVALAAAAVAVSYACL